MGDKKTAGRVRRVLKWTLALLGVLIAALVVAGLVVANSQDGSVRMLQSSLYSRLGYEPNSFEPRKPASDTVRPDGVRIRSNLEYASRYPNSFLDIWYPDADSTARRPTVIYIHGGGFFMGDKVEGDPMAAGQASPNGSALEVMVREGLNVVSIDYALAPEYRYPVPVRQLDEAIAFLDRNAQAFGLDMDNVILMGGSAGAQMSAQYGLLLSNPAYANEVGIKPSIDRSRVKGLVLFSAPMGVSGFGWRMNAMMWAYLGTKDLEKSRQARQTDLLAHVGPNFPPAYITDGNQPDTFGDHAKALAKLLQDKNVDHVLNYYEPEVAKLDHGYTGRLDTRYGRENIEKAIAFIKQRTTSLAPPVGHRGRTGVRSK